MWIVILDNHSGYFGPFHSEEGGRKYIAAGSGEGRVIHLIQPWTVGTEFTPASEVNEEVT